MQTGAENRPKLIAAIVLGVLALALVGRWLFAGGPSGATSAARSTSVPAAEAPVPLEPRATAPLPGKAAKKRPSSLANSLDPTLRFDWLRNSEDTKYQGTGRNIFRAQVDIPKPIAPGHTDKPVLPAVPPGPPPPPPIELKFYGFASKPGEPKRVFLAKGEDIFIASEGDIVDRRYKVLRISPVSVEIEDVLNNNRQEIPLTQG
jgi:hypothetical protein